MVFLHSGDNGPAPTGAGPFRPAGGGNSYEWPAVCGLTRQARLASEYSYGLRFWPPASTGGSAPGARKWKLLIAVGNVA